MAEPTIDEMLAWLETIVMLSEQPQPKESWSYTDAAVWANRGMFEGIRAILEQHREPPIDEIAAKILAEMRERNIPVVSFAEEKQRIALNAVRAFVERVEKRAHASGIVHWSEAFVTGIAQELAAMTKETE